MNYIDSLFTPASEDYGTEETFEGDLTVDNSQVVIFTSSRICIA